MPLTPLYLADEDPSQLGAIRIVFVELPDIGL